MEKLTTILAVALNAEDVGTVLDRAMSIARHFGARVEVLVSDSQGAHAVTARCREVEYPQVTMRSVASEPLPPHEIILRRVLATSPDLVVKVPSAVSARRSLAFLDDDWRLANECPVPILLARGKPWDSPLRFAAAVDVSDEDNTALARSILHTAGFLALGVHGNLDILYTEREALDEAVRMKRAVRLAQLVREYHVGCERLQMFSGAPETRLPPLLAARHYDVLVLGGQSRREGLDRLIPGTATQILAATDSDVILVKAPASGVSLEVEPEVSRRAASESRRATAAN